MSDRFPGFVDREAPFQTLWITAKAVTILGWVGTGLLVVLLIYGIAEHGETRDVFGYLVDSLLLILAGGAVRILIVIERNTRART